jgi:ABC-type Mn2+/Zn2+ transport system ATPase subunit
MIVLEGIAVRKSGVVLLDGIDLCLGKKELVGVIGPNGAGKTTLMNVIAGFESFEGSLLLFGHRVSQRRSRRMRRRIAYVPQSLSLDPTFPILAREAVLTAASGRLGLFRLPGRAERAEALGLMETMRIAHLADRPLGQLSGGERQKVSLARASSNSPRSFSWTNLQPTWTWPSRKRFWTSSTRFTTRRP